MLHACTRAQRAGTPLRAREQLLSGTPAALPTDLAQHVKQVRVGNVGVASGNERVVAQVQRGQELACAGQSGDTQTASSFDGGAQGRPWKHAGRLMDAFCQLRRPVSAAAGPDAARGDIAGRVQQ